jgi:hypothetical protein
MINENTNDLKKNGAGIKLNSIDDVTLEFMVNTAQYEKYLRKNHIDFDSGFKRDLRFYRKRIISLTKDLFKSENGIQNCNENQNIDVTMVGAFNMYMRACISYLKFSDQSETIQKCYVCLGISNENTDVKKCICKNNGENDENNINELNRANALCFKPKDVKKITLDNYVIRKNVKKAEPVVYPQQFTFNPKDPSFKYKGLKSKTSIAQAQVVAQTQQTQVAQTQVAQAQHPEKLTLLVKEEDKNNVNYANNRENGDINEKDKIKAKIKGKNNKNNKNNKNKKVSFDITNYVNNI